MRLWGVRRLKTSRTVISNPKKNSINKIKISEKQGEEGR